MISEDEINAGKNRAYFENLYTNYLGIINDASALCSDAVVKKWHEIKSSWLWVNNIWVADATIYPFQSYDNMKDIAKQGGYTDYVNEHIDKAEYEIISSIVNSEGGRKNNGFFILAILAALVTFASQYIMEKTSTHLKNKDANALAKQSMDGSMEMSMKIMKFIMPIMMVLFVLTSSASFGIYILASNIASIGLGQLVNLIVNNITKKQQLEVEEVLAKQAKKLIKQGKLQEKN